jgi:hypothetical protein
MSADSLARALEARRSGSSWMAKCIAHALLGKAARLVLPELEDRKTSPIGSL